jgi:hypothetical protein
MFGRLPAFGLYCRHATGVRIRDVEFRGAAGETRPAIVCDDVKGLDVKGLRSTKVASSQPVVKLIQTKDAWIDGCAAPAGTQSFLQVEGSGSANILLSGSDLRGAEKPVQTGADVPSGAVVARAT